MGLSNKYHQTPAVI